MKRITLLTTILFFCLTANAAAQSPQRIFMIGNSLTWDTYPHELYRQVEYHIDCGRNLQYIFDNPAAPCLEISHLWTDALVNDVYDVVVVQPFYDTTLEQDIAIISHWMTLQPNAQFILHTGWPEHNRFELEYNTTTLPLRMVHAPLYFDVLRAELLALHPGRTVGRNDAIGILNEISHDIQAEVAPFTSLSDGLYRDNIHMNYPTGNYLMHNLMRLTLEQPMRFHDFRDITPENKAYLDRKLCEHIYLNYEGEPTDVGTHIFCYIHTRFLPLINR